MFSHRFSLVDVKRNHKKKNVDVELNSWNTNILYVIIIHLVLHYYALLQFNKTICFITFVTKR